MEQKTQATLAYKIKKKNVYNACFGKGASSFICCRFTSLIDRSISELKTVTEIALNRNAAYLCLSIMDASLHSINESVTQLFKIKRGPLLACFFWRSYSSACTISLKLCIYHHANLRLHVQKLP